MKQLTLIAPEFPDDFGGIQIYSYEVAKGLHRLGWKVTVLTRKKVTTRLKTDFKVRHVLRSRRYLDYPVIIQTLNLSDVILCTNFSYAWVANHHSNVFCCIHGNDFLAPYFFTGGRDFFKRAFGKGDKFDFLINTTLTNLLLKRSTKQIRRWFANSHFSKDQFLAKFPHLEPDSVTVAGIGLSEEFITRSKQLELSPSSSRLPQFLTVCRMHEKRKNIDELLKAYRLLADRYDFQATIVGDGPFRQEYEQLAAELKLGGRVQFLGEIPREKLFLELEKADLFVLPPRITSTSYEGFGIVFIEANALGLPVLSTRVGGIPEAIREGITGYFAESHEAPQLAEALERFLSGSVTFDRTACQQHGQQHTWEHVVNVMDEKMREIPTESNSPQD